MFRFKFLIRRKACGKNNKLKLYMDYKKIQILSFFIELYSLLKPAIFKFVFADAYLNYYRRYMDIVQIKKSIKHVIHAMERERE